MNELEKREIYYNLSQNGNIKGYQWIYPDKDIKGVLVISHGMAEHINRYDEFALELCNQGYTVFGHNHRGHKDSILTDDDYGYMNDEDNFNILVSDLLEIINKIKEQYPNLPLYLFGHSMGSFVSQRFVELYGNKIQGLILCGSSKNPKILVNMGIFLSKMVMNIKGRRYRSKFINNIVFGSYNNKFKPNKTDFDWLNSNSDEVDIYVNDKYCGGIFTVSYFYDFFRGLNTICKNYDLIPKKLPILIISGDKDPVGGYGKYITNLYSTLKNKEIIDLEMILYKNGRHEILKEYSKKQTFNDVINWLEQKVNI